MVMQCLLYHLMIMRNGAIEPINALISMNKHILIDCIYKSERPHGFWV